MLVANCKNDFPVHVFVIVNHDIAEADGFSHILGQIACNDSTLRQHLEVLPHSAGRSQLVMFGNPMGCHINAQLDGPRQIQRQNVLRINISLKYFRTIGATILQARNASPKRLEFLID